MKTQLSKEDMATVGDLHSIVRSDRLKLLYQQSIMAIVGSLVVAAIMARILWWEGHHEAPIIWFYAVVAATVLRVLLFLSYRRDRPKDDELLKWERPYLLTMIFLRAVWGVGALFIAPDHSLQSHAIVMFFLMISCGSALSVYSAHRFFAMLAILIVIGPYTLWLLYLAEPAFMLMAIGALVFVLSANRATAVAETALTSNMLLTHQLSAAKANAEDEARQDVLTGLMNRRAFEEYASKLLNASERSRRPITLIVLDLDHFKQVNDTFGHTAGDQALRQTGRLIRESVRGADLCARLGGEEFAILLPNAIRDQGVIVAEKLRKLIMTTAIELPDGELSMTASFGVAEGFGSLADLVKLADEAMYRAKKGGRNLVCV